MRSVWKLQFSDNINVYKTVLYSGQEQAIVYSRRSIIFPEYVGRRFLIYTGKEFISLLIRDWHVNNRFSDFVLTKKIGGSIHKNKKKK
jgi:small subunit ribosomal protein S19